MRNRMSLLQRRPRLVGSLIFMGMFAVSFSSLAWLIFQSFHGRLQGFWIWVAFALLEMVFAAVFILMPSQRRIADRCDEPRSSIGPP